MFHLRDMWLARSCDPRLVQSTIDQGDVAVVQADPLQVMTDVTPVISAMLTPAEG